MYGVCTKVSNSIFSGYFFHHSRGIRVYFSSILSQHTCIESEAKRTMVFQPVLDKERAIFSTVTTSCTAAKDILKKVCKCVHL